MTDSSVATSAIHFIMIRLGKCSWTSRVFGRIFDVVVLIFVIGGLALSYSGYIRPRGAGFYCNDQSIRFAYTGDTISVVQLFLGSLLAPIFFILPIELCKKWQMYRQTSVRSFLLRVWQCSWKVWRAVLLGNLAVLIVTEFAKGLISEARPHFWDTCKPNVTQEICDSGYVVEFTCTSDYSNRKILDAQKSFPSGHTSLSAYVSLFMMWYLGRAVQSRHSIVLKPCLQLIWAAFAIVCALTRITDRRHHWWDVLAGFTLGITIGTILIQAMSRSIRWSDGDDDDSAGDGGASNDSSEQGQQFKDASGVNDNVTGGSGGMNFQMNMKAGNSSSPSHNKRPSVRRLLSVSSAATTIAEDNEINI